MAMRVSRSGGVRSAMSPHSNRERRRSSRVVIALGGRSEERTICLPASWMALKVWKNSSCPLALGDELDVVDEEHVDAPVSVPEVLHLLLANGVDEVVRELLARRVEDPLAGELRGDRVADGVHQVGLAQAHAAVQEERVVGVPRTLRDREGGGMGEPVRRSHDEVAEAVARVQVDGVAPGRDGRQRQGLLADLGRDRAGRVRDHELDLDRAADDPRQGLADQGPVAVVEPVTGKTVGNCDAKAVLVDLDEGGVLEPGLEIGG